MPRSLLFQYADFYCCAKTEPIKERYRENPNDTATCLTVTTTSLNMGYAALSAVIGAEILHAAGWSVLGAGPVAAAGAVGAAVLLGPLNSCGYFCNGENSIDEFDSSKNSVNTKNAKRLASVGCYAMLPTLGTSVLGTSAGKGAAFAAASGAIGGAVIIVSSIVIFRIGKACFLQATDKDNNGVVTRWSEEQVVNQATLQRQIDQSYITRHQFSAIMDQSAEEHGLNTSGLQVALINAQTEQLVKNPHAQTMN